MATVAARSLFRSARTTASRINAAAAAKPKPSRSPFRMPTQNPLSPRISSRLPVEMSVVSIESMLPYHTATASALLTSMLSVTPRTFGWTLEDCIDDL